MSHLKRTPGSMTTEKVDADFKKGGRVHKGHHKHHEEHPPHHRKMEGGRTCHAKGGRAHAAGGKWMGDAVKHPGKLHRDLGIPEGKKIPAKRLEAAEHSRSPVIRKEAHLAETFKKYRPHKKG